MKKRRVAPESPAAPPLSAGSSPRIAAAPIGAAAPPQLSDSISAYLSPSHMATSSASPARVPMHAPKNSSGHPLPSVREVIGDQERQVFVISDDDSPPPAAPLHPEEPGARLPGVPPPVHGKRKGSSQWPPPAEDGEGRHMSPTKRRRQDAGPEPCAFRYHDMPPPGSADFAALHNYFAPYDAAADTSGGAPPSAPLYPMPSDTLNAFPAPAAAPAAAPPTTARTPVFPPAPPRAYGMPAAQPWRAPEPAAPLAGMAQKPIDDKEGHFIVREGDFITPRYQIRGLLGQGTFGKVVHCYDRRLRRPVAIKVIRAIQKYRDASQIEIRVLRCIREHDPLNKNQCVEFLETFDYRNHVCIVSELLSRSVFDFLKENQFQPFPPRDIWLFAKQILKSVCFLHDLSLVHTDLKPENVLLVDASYDVVSTSRRANARKKRVLRNAEIRLIDFGSATFNDEYHSGVVSTRHYRAPEIILGMGWSFPCDVWSIGCILVEFFTGDALFQTHDNLEHLAMMEMVLGRLPDGYRRKAETYKPEYFRHGQLCYPNAETTKQSRRYVQSMKRLREIISGPSAYAKHNERFYSLLRGLLEYDPGKRMTVHQAIQHPYFDLQPNDFPA